MKYVILKTKYSPMWGSDVCVVCETQAQADRIANQARFYGGWRYINIRKSKPGYDIPTENYQYKVL